MARPLRVEYPGALYHVTCRGNARGKVFLIDSDRELFLQVLAQVVERFNWRCHAYCQMTNHYHLLVETVDPTLARGMRQLNGVYTQEFNRRHSRTGHVFQGRYKAILVERDAYLLELARYVVLNPVRAKMVRRAQDCPWSSYRATAGLEDAPSFLTTDWILEQFGSSAKKAQADTCLQDLTLAETPRRDHLQVDTLRRCPPDEPYFASTPPVFTRVVSCVDMRCARATGLGLAITHSS